LVLLVLAGVVLAGCSAPGGVPPSDGSGDVSYPSGWGPDGPENATRAIHGADEAVAGEDFVERWVSVEETSSGIDEPYLVVVTEVRVDRGAERLMNHRQFYLVDAELATVVAEDGTEPLADRKPNEVRQTYLDAEGGTQFHRLENRSPRITALESEDFNSATDQPLPAALLGSLPVFESATYANPTQADGGVRYSISDVSAFQIEDGAGHTTVGSGGVVTGYNVSETDPESAEAFRYRLERGDVSVEPPEWAG
jgi:hypothetical protein